MTSLHTADLVFDRRIKGHMPVTRLAVSDSGTVMAAVPDQYQPRLYHLVRLSISGEWKELGPFSVETVRGIDFCEDGGFFAAITDDDLYAFDDGEKVRLFPERRENFLGISVSSAGDLFAVASSDMIVSSNSVTLAKSCGAQVWVKSLSADVTGIRLAPDASKLLIGTDDGTALMLNSSRDTIWELDGEDSITAVDMSLVGDISILGDKLGKVQAVGIRGNMLWKSEGIGPIKDCAVSGDGKLIAVGRETSSGQGIVELLMADGTPILEHGTVAGISSIASSPDGKYVAVSCEDGTLQVLEITLAAARSVEKAQALYDEGVAAAAKGDYAEANGKFAEVLQICPSNVDACRRLIETRNSLVANCIAAAKRLGSEDKIAEAMQELRIAGELCLYQQEVVEQLAQVRSSLVSEALASARSLADKGELVEALAKLQEIVKVDFADIHAREQLALVEDALVSRYAADAEKSEAPEAVALLEKAAALRPTPDIEERLAQARAKQAFDAGMALYDAQKYSQAVFQFKKVLSIDPRNAEAQKYIQYAESLRQDDVLFDRFSKLE